MSRYIINIKNDKQASGLKRYLESLDFIEVRPIKPDLKAQAATSAKDFLKGLPNQTGKQADVNKIVKSIRKKHGYQ